MDTTTIDRQIEMLDKGVNWGKNYIKEDVESQNFHRRLVNIRREMSKIQYALSERCAAATFGESQMGKSYLVNSMFSDSSTPFSVNNGGRTYVFKNDINPSEANSQIEATGVVTRFTSRPIQMPQGVPDNFLCAQMLSVADIILILSEAYYNEVDYKVRDLKEWTNNLNDRISAVKIGGSQNLLSEEDVLNIEEYFINTQLAKKCGPILSEDVRYFQYLLKFVTCVSDSELVALIKLLWNENENINKLFDGLIQHYRELNFSSLVFVDFDAILKKHGTLVDVARLDEMFINAPDVCPPEYRRTTRVYIPSKGIFECEKSFLSALTTELTLNIVLPDDDSESRNFFDKLDILDFPGACPDEHFKESELYEPKKLTRVYRRGKVSYLFKKYSVSRRISTLLFCHNNRDCKYGLMGRELQNWIETNIGKNMIQRDAYIRSIGMSPFFIISTWFNTDLEYADKKPGDDLNYLWQRRFNAVLSTGVLKYSTVEDHWLDHWTDTDQNFQNIYLLRDFDHSKMIFRGYDPIDKTPEMEVHSENYARYPNFLEDLKDSFVKNDFVKKHFSNPGLAWDESATPTNDGTLPVMRALNKLAPNIAEARDKHFSKELEKLQKELLSVLENLYESGDAGESIKKTNRLAGRINLSIDSRCGEDPYFFGKLMDAIMIPEAVLYEMVFDQLKGKQQELPLTDKEAQIYMNANLDSVSSREENIQKLCCYLGVEDEQECAETLSEDSGVDLERLLCKTQMLVSSAEHLVNYVEEYWYNTFLMDTRVNLLKDKLPFISDVFENLYRLYNTINLHDKIVQRVDKYIKDLKADVQPRIIADFLAMEYNHFIMCCGYDYIQSQSLSNLENQSDDNKLNINWTLLHHKKTKTGITLLSSMDVIMDKLANKNYGAEIHDLQLELPEYKSRWLWQQQLKVAMLIVCNIPNPRYGVLANEELGILISQIKSLK